MVLKLTLFVKGKATDSLVLGRILRLSIDIAGIEWSPHVALRRPVILAVLLTISGNVVVHGWIGWAAYDPHVSRSCPFCVSKHKMQFSNPLCCG